MREILFRGKDEETKEWIFGQLDTEIPGIKVNGYRYYHAVIPETVGQYTGLTDKNGKRIFEGDVLKHGDGLLRIVYDEKYACFGSPDSMFDFVSMLKGADVEIIGNIHDNPELLETEGEQE